MALKLPLGFRFRPTEVEIIDFYLRSKITGINDGELGFIPVVDFFKQEPRELPGLSGFETTDDHERFCFSPPDMKQPNGKQFNRTTNSGFWKVTGKDKEIWSGGRLIGKKKILVFHLGSAANSKKTDWVLHEHHINLEELDGTKPGQKPFVFCRLKYEPKQNSGKAPESPAFDRHPTTNESRHSENCDGMACDTIATRPAKSASESPDKGSKGRKRKNSSKAGRAKSKRSAASASPATENQVAEMKLVIADEVDLQPESNLWTPSTSLSDTAAVLSPNTAKSSPEEAASGLAQALASPASVQADGTTSDTRAPVDCGDNNFNAYSAENQVTDTEFDQQLQEELKWLPFLLQNQIDWNVNSPNTAKSSPEEAEASASPASGEEAENHVTSYSPTKELDESTSNTKAFTGCNRISDNTQTTTNQATAGDQVGDSNMSCAPLELPVPDIDWSSLLLCPILSQMQKVLDNFSMSDLVANEPNYLHDAVPSQYGTNDTAIYYYKSELWGPMPNNPDESLSNDPSGQKKVAFGLETMKNMESVMDDGSRSAVNAKMFNALKFDTVPVQDSMWSVEIEEMFHQGC